MLRRATFTLLLILAATLSACSSMRLVDGQVQSFSRLSETPAPASYRIERLPSQQSAAFDTIAALAEQSLARAGLHRDEAAPRLLVQIGTQADSVPRYDPFAPSPFFYGYDPPPWAWGPPWAGGWHGSGLWRMGPSPLYRRAVSLVLRDAQTQAIVYETSAVHEDVWVSDPAVYGVLFDAALDGFPRPPIGSRQVRLPLNSSARKP